MSNIKMIYFGCWKDAGHFIWFPNWEQKRNFEIEKLRLPQGYYLDATMLFLPEVERVGTGMITYLPAPDLTVIAWWGSAFDKRGKVNCALIVEGKKNLDEAWQLFKENFPLSNDLIEKPMIFNKLNS